MTLREGPLTLACASLVFVERGALVFAAALAEGHPRRALAVAVGAAGIFVVRTALGNRLRHRVEAHLHRAAVESALLGELFDVRDEELHTSLFRGIDAATTVLGRARPALLGEGLALVAVVAWLVATQSVERVGVLLAVALGTLLAALVARRFSQRAQDEMWGRYQEACAAVLSGVLARVELVASGSSTSYLENVAERVRRWQRSAARASLGAAFLGRAPLALAMGAVLLAATLHAGSASLAGLVVLGSALAPLAGVLHHAAELVREGPAFDALNEHLARPRAPRRVSPRPVTLPNRLRFEGVTVRYPHTEDDALTDVDCELPARGLVLLSGANGSGKSTVLRLALGILAATKGAVRVGDVDLAEADLDDFRARLAYLPQRAYLPPGGSTREAMGFLRAADDATMQRALERTGAWEVLRSKDRANPLALVVDAFSTGERQRIALARCLLQPADVYLLDEPDANLDAPGVRLVRDLLVELSKEALVLVAAHTQQLIDAADRVIHLEGGRVVSGAQRSTTPGQSPDTAA